jgi:hypothetical protein
MFHFLPAHYADDLEQEQEDQEQAGARSNGPESNAAAAPAVAGYPHATETTPANGRESLNATTVVPAENVVLLDKKRQQDGGLEST